jgi:hypothetical protein
MARQIAHIMPAARQRRQSRSAVDIESRDCDCRIGTLDCRGLPACIRAQIIRLWVLHIAGSTLAVTSPQIG